MKSQNTTNNIPAARPTMNGKSVLELPCKSVLTYSGEFSHKKLTSGPTLNLGDACAYSCTYCYVPAISRKRLYSLLGNTSHCDVVIRRQNGLDLLEANLQKLSPAAKNACEVCFTSTCVDPAANMDLLRETAQALTRIFEATNWDIRILSKSNLLPKLPGLVPAQFHQRMIFGVSTGTLDNKLGQAIERGTPFVSKRIDSLRWLQDNGFRTFGMICPSLPQEDYDIFSKEICQAIRVERCEHVWAEPINTRGASFQATVEALRKMGYRKEVGALETVCGPGSKASWDDYAKETFQAHAKYVPPSKLRFLHYPTIASLNWWQAQIHKGAVLLGAIAHP